jgi:hypothetical protein
MPTIAVPNATYPPSQEVLARATLVLPSLHALSLAVIAGLGVNGH